MIKCNQLLFFNFYFLGEKCIVFWILWRGFFDLLQGRKDEEEKSEDAMRRRHSVCFISIILKRKKWFLQNSTAISQRGRDKSNICLAESWLPLWLRLRYHRDILRKYFCSLITPTLSFWMPMSLVTHNHWNHSANFFEWMASVVVF